MFKFVQPVATLLPDTHSSLTVIAMYGLAVL